MDPRVREDDNCKRVSVKRTELLSRLKSSLHPTRLALNLAFDARLHRAIGFHPVNNSMRKIVCQIFKKHFAFALFGELAPDGVEKCSVTKLMLQPGCARITSRIARRGWLAMA